MAGVKEPIRLREKKLKNGNTSLYLDIYRNGRREYEFLKLYLTPEKNREDKEKNRQTLQLANSIKAQRTVEMQNGVFGFKSQFAEDPSSSSITRRCVKVGSDRKAGGIGATGTRASTT